MYFVSNIFIVNGVNCHNSDWNSQLQLLSTMKNNLIGVRTVFAQIFRNVFKQDK